MAQQDAVIGEVVKTKSGFRVRFYWLIGFFSVVIVGIVTIAAWPLIVVISTYFAIAFGTILTIATILGVVYLAWLAWHSISHKRRRDEATTKAMENQAAIVVHGSNDVAYRWGEDGQLFPIYHPLPKSAALALPGADAGPSSLDFYTVMTQAKRVYSIIADQQTGKTTLCHYLVERWQSQGIKPVVISQKYDHGDYLNCEQYGPDGESILAGFDLVQQEAAYRQQLASEGTPFAEMGLQPVFLEDFTSLGSIIDRRELEQFVSQSLTVFAARGLLLYFVVHSRTKDAFGLGKQGASLKDQATRLEIIPAYDAQGRVDHQRKQIVCSIGSNLDAVPVTGIPSHMPNLQAYDCQTNLYSLALPIAQLEPTPTEASILRRYDQGQGVSAIATAIFGAQSSHTNEKVKSVLRKFEREIKDQRVKYDLV